MAPRYAARQDATHRPVVDALEAAGAKVERLHPTRAGIPDLLVGYRGALTLVEVKAKGGKCSAEQLAEHEHWAKSGVKVAVVRSAREALAAIGADEQGREREREDLGRLALAMAKPQRARTPSLPPGVILRPSRRGPG